MSDNKFGFGKIKTFFFNKLKPELPKRLAQHMLLFYRTNYNKEGYMTERTFIPWKERKFKVNRKLLVKSGDMRDGMYVVAQDFSNIKIGNDTEYFDYHNEGTDHIPARPMIYESDQLEDEIEKIIEENIWKLFG